MRDVDGDGRGDIVIGAPRVDVAGHADAGQIDVWTAAGTRAFTGDQLGGSVQDDALLGSAVSSWNLVDGPPADVAAGAPGQGAVFVLSGPSLRPAGMLTEPSAGLTPQAGDLFGATLY